MFRQNGVTEEKKYVSSKITQKNCNIIGELKLNYEKKKKKMMMEVNLDYLI